jgi:hypothetical protein
MIKIKDKTKEDLDSERNNLSNKLKESKVIYIKEKILVIKNKKQKKKIIIPKRNIYLVIKRI